jgi:hypothetical protein
MSDYTDELFKRADELKESGLGHFESVNIAQVELRVEQHWPVKWGDNLEVLIYGDFDAPASDLDFPSLGITVKAGRVENSIISTARCVLTAQVKVSEKSLPAVFDAIQRVNTLLGIWTVTDWCNRGIGWWCHLTVGSMGGIGGPIKQDGVESAIEGLNKLPPEIREKVRAALYWIRDPVGLMMEQFKDDTLRVYAGYWNAFECLVEAACIFRPLSKMTKQQKLDGIKNFIAERNGTLDVNSLAECYRLFGDPGFVAKASHALRLCFAQRADGYIQECFRVKPDKERLYAIRNAINHGDIDYEDIFERFRIADRLHRLKAIVLGMLGRMIPFSCPVDPGP